MPQSVIPEDVRRFVLTSIASVPYLEALLLLRNDADVTWTSGRVAQRLYLSEKNAEALLVELTGAGIAMPVAEHPGQYRYQPDSMDLRGLIDRLAAVYAKHLVEITHLIHSRTDRKAQQFADAFKLRKDS
jgi:hypothetical protein